VTAPVRTAARALLLVPALVAFLFGGAAAAAPGAGLNATYLAAPPASVGAGSLTPISVTVTNAGDEPWPASGPTPVNLSYHWYDAQGAVVVWNGTRAPLGTDLPVGGTRTLSIPVLAPPTPGAYTLRFALVKEGVAWIAPGPVHQLAVLAAFQERFGQVTPPQFVATGSYTVSVPVTNTGVATWNAGGPNAVALAYHWHDATGATVVWDGARSPLAADLAPGASATVSARVVAPDRSGTYTLTLDLVREGVGWFAALGPSTPFRAPVAVAIPVVGASYAIPAGSASYIGERRTIAVTVTNTGNLPIATGGKEPVSLSYHLIDASGATLVWDGPRTALGADLAPGASRSVPLTFTTPAQPGAYTLALDLVREGVAWYSGLGSPPGKIALTVTSGLAAGYGASTTPALATIGATLQLTVQLTNYGPRTWAAAGPTPVRLSYHILDADGRAVVWDGARGLLPADVPAGATVTVPVDVALPQRTGAYTVSWDLVQEGVSWFSAYGIARKDEAITVQPGVTFYGKGYGHGVGLSQYGAQGWATGAVGLALTGEQIVARYYPGTSLANVDLARGALRVLLSSPSSAGRFSCGMPAFDAPLANAVSGGGFRVLNEGGANALIGVASPNVTWQIAARNGIVQVWNQATVTKVFEGPGPVVLVPIDPLQPIRVQEKGTYRGNFKLSNVGGTLRLVNYVSYDDYTRGVLPSEMPRGWHLEAYKAQAYAARTYAYAKYAGGARDYDVLDDQQDQCYGGTGVETAPTDAAAAATAGKVIAYQGVAIRAYYASSNGGYSMSDGCWAGNLRTTPVVACGAGQPYLLPVPDPADLAVTVPVANRHRTWTVSFTSAEVREAILRYKSIDIGTLLSVDVTNRVPVTVGHVVSVKVQGTGAALDLPADVFLRTHLGLKSTMVRLSPF